ncbi:MAG: DUF2271 domain-containing protein [Phycisphaeraceae bacterium]
MNALRYSVVFVLLASVAGMLPACANGPAHSKYIYAPVDAMPGESFVAAGAGPAKVNPNWPAGFKLDIDVSIAEVRSPKYRRPYLAVWIENPAVKDKAVRFLIVWGKEIKYQNTLKYFTPLAKFNGRTVDAVTRPTRPPGEYTVTWDGLDDAGKPVAAGDYAVHVEVSREHGTRVHMSKTITCKDAKQEEMIDGNLEVAGVVLRFGTTK